LSARHSLRPLISEDGDVLGKPRAKACGEIAKPCLGKRPTAADSRLIHGIQVLTFVIPHRYINPARHVRGFWRLDWKIANDGIDTVERRPRRSAGRRLLFRCWASRHPRDGSHPRPLCRRRDRKPSQMDELAQLERLIDVPRSRSLCRGDRPTPRYPRNLAKRPVRFASSRFSRGGSRRMKQPVRSPAQRLCLPGRALTFANVAEGRGRVWLSRTWRAQIAAAGRSRRRSALAVVCRDGPRMQQLARALEFFAPDLPVLQFPAWDCQPYDRVIAAWRQSWRKRLTTLARLVRGLPGSDKPLIVSDHGQRHRASGCRRAR